jgi:hypothetical protein
MQLKADTSCVNSPAAEKGKRPGKGKMIILPGTTNVVASRNQ